jgi:lambda repressor-like predicted transcriptional regulator
MQNERDLSLKKKTPTRDQILRARRNFLVYKLKQKGLTISGFAKKIAVSPQAVTNCIRAIPLGDSSARIERALSKIVGEPVQNIFCDRYLSSGQPLRPRGRPPKENNTKPFSKREEKWKK